MRSETTTMPQLPAIPDPAFELQSRLWVVIAVYNRCELTRQCLQALHRQRHKHFSIVVVDDGSSDGTGQMLQEEFPQVHVVRGDGNLWWTGATRAGIDYVLARCQSYDAVVLLNDDLQVDPDFLTTLEQVAGEQPDTLIGSVVLDAGDPDLITDGGTTIHWRSARWERMNHEKRLSVVGTSFQAGVSTLTGRGVLIPVEAFDCIGLYNNRHFPQHGDTELPIRAQRAGYRLIVDYRCQVFCRHDLAGDVNEARHYRFAQIRDMLTNPRSYFYWKERFWFAFHTRQGWVQFAIFLACDTARVTAHLLSRLAIGPRRPGSADSPE